MLLSFIMVRRSVDKCYLLTPGILPFRLSSVDNFFKQHLVRKLVAKLCNKNHNNNPCDSLNKNVQNVKFWLPLGPQEKALSSSFKIPSLPLLWFDQSNLTPMFIWANFKPCDDYVVHCFCCVFVCIFRF